MGRTSAGGVFRSILAFSTMFIVGGGCIAMYSFDREPPIACKKVEDCPGSDVCGQRLCENGSCKMSSVVEAGTLTINNERGNCQRFVCDGRGNEILEIDDTDIRIDGDNCTEDICTNGIASNPPSDEGKQCGAVASVKCSATGDCEGCTVASDCGADTICAWWTCDENKVCVKNLAIAGKEADNPVPGDCKKNLCNAVGESPEEFAADDAPSDDNPCTSDYCTLEGTVVHELLATGAYCGPCLACNAEGKCAACDPATTVCYDDKCVPKGQPCDDKNPCENQPCVDGFCCDSECSSMCMACSNDKTGAPSGICAPILNGTDPDNECNNPEADTCLDGNCSCEDGDQNGNETGTDCGGFCNQCTGKWNCGGDTVCDGNVTPTCCEQVFSLCFACTDNSQMCKNLHGTTCVIGANNQRVTFGLVGQGNCIPTFNACKFVDCKCQ